MRFLVRYYPRAIILFWDMAILLKWQFRDKPRLLFFWFELRFFNSVAWMLAKHRHFINSHASMYSYTYKFYVCRCQTEYTWIYSIENILYTTAELWAQFPVEYGPIRDQPRKDIDFYAYADDYNIIAKSQKENNPHIDLNNLFNDIQIWCSYSGANLSSTKCKYICT